MPFPACNQRKSVTRIMPWQERWKHTERSLFPRFLDGVVFFHKDSGLRGYYYPGYRSGIYLIGRLWSGNLNSEATSLLRFNDLNCIQGPGSPKKIWWREMSPGRRSKPHTSIRHSCFLSGQEPHAEELYCQAQEQRILNKQGKNYGSSGGFSATISAACW